MYRADLLYPELSYSITGLCFTVHNEIGRYGREKQYGDLLEKTLRDQTINFLREVRVGDTGNVIDFTIEDKIVLELKAKPFIIKEDYFQVQRYLHSVNMQLGLIINFRDTFLKPKRVIKVDNVSQ